MVIATGAQPMTHRKRIGRGALVTLIALAQSACTTTLVSSWKAPDAAPFAQQGEKVAAVVMSAYKAIRLAGEDTLARQLSLHGVDGIPMHTLLPDADQTDEARARAAAEAAGVVGIVVMRPVQIDRALSATLTYVGPPYGELWGGYYGYGWSSPWGREGVDVRTDTIITIETLVYDLRENKLVWAGQSKTTNPLDLDHLVQDTAKRVASELTRLGLMRRT